MIIASISYNEPKELLKLSILSLSFSDLSNKLKQILSWLAPTGLEIVAYIGITALTLLISNIKSLQQLLSYPADLSLKGAIVGSLDTLLSHFFGERLAATLATGVFWSFIGVLVYILFWLVGNFSSEVSNDLTITKYVHPKDVNVYTPLKDFASRSVFQIIILLYLFLFLNLAFQVLLPLWTLKFSNLLTYGLSSVFVKGALLAGLGELAMLHIVVVLARLLVLKKRLFSHYQI